MSGAMRAAVLRNPGPKNEKPLTVEDRPVPEPGREFVARQYHPAQTRLLQKRQAGLQIPAPKIPPSVKI